MRFGALARKAGAASTAALGAGALVVGTAVPGFAADEAPGGTANAAALEAEVAGKVVGQQLEAVYDGTEQVTNGPHTPELPELVTGGLLSQDAIGGQYFSAACAGLLGGGAKVSLKADGTCITDPNGTVEVSLGTLSGLGVEDLMSKLPEVPDVPDLDSLLGGLPLPDLSGEALPDANLKIVGRAITARCMAEPTGAVADSTAAHLQLVADVDGKAVVLGNITKDGLTLSHQELLAKVTEVLPTDAREKVGDVLTVLDELPTSQLTEQLPQLTELISIEPNVQSQTATGVEVTALQASLAAPATAGVLDRLPTEMVTDKLGDTLGNLTGGLNGALTGDLTEKLQGADLGGTALRIGHVSCSVPSGTSSDDTVDVRTGEAQQGSDASSQRSLTEDRNDADLDSVTGRVDDLVGTVQSLLNVL